MKAQKLVRGEQLRRASELGTLLLGRLKPGGARKNEAERSDAAQVTARDRLATLLWQRYRDVRKAAYYLWGDAFDTQVPALQARQRARASHPKTPATRRHHQTLPSDSARRRMPSPVACLGPSYGETR